MNKNAIPDDYSRRIRQLRVDLGLTQERMADLMGVSFASVNRWENGQNRPNQLAWEKIVRAEKLGRDGLTGEYGETRARERTRPYGTSDEIPENIDFSAAPEVVRSVAEGERLSYGHLFNPTFASEISRIDPLPHQRIAVYERMLEQEPLRFLLADDAGAGKTIMTGLYVREMLARRRISRVLIAPPAGLVGNWHSELRTLFSLSFEVATGSDAKDDNPFIGESSDLRIVSMDTLASERTFARLQEPEVEPYDLVVFDEAHKLSARQEYDGSVRKTRRYRLGEALAGARVEEERWQLPWSAHHLLLLTATPHQGKQFPYYALWRLLEPEVLSTQKAFDSYPAEARRQHFIRRTKEQMVRFDGEPIYPTRVSDTFTYELGEGPVSERKLYEETTEYLENYYNKASILNRMAARFAMSIFQRRLASSTYALLQSLQRRRRKLDNLIRKVESGQYVEETIEKTQQKLAPEDVFETRTADEETREDGREQNELAEEEALEGVAAQSLEDLRAERERVDELTDLARRVHRRGEESKFTKLREILEDPDYSDEKLIIFTQHRDTLRYLVDRLESIGHTDRIAEIHGGMSYPEREEQVEFFRKDVSEGGAQYLVATDAAGEGINLQFCWIMVNYDVPWNPARLEQRMGRIHRYGQEEDPVVILNLAAEDTREGRVIKTLTEKLEKIRQELGSDKVFDVVGRVMEDTSIKEYMNSLAAGEDPDRVAGELDDRITKESVREAERQQEEVYGGGDAVRPELERLRGELQDEAYVRLLPGYVHRFIEEAAPLTGIGIDGDLESGFTFYPESPGALDELWPVLEQYPPDRRDRLTVKNPDPDEKCVWLRPGEPVFEKFRAVLRSSFGGDARRGATFVDPWTTEPYVFHLCRISVLRRAEEQVRGFETEETLESRVIGLRQTPDGQIERCAPTHLLLVEGTDGVPLDFRNLAGRANDLAEKAAVYARNSIAHNLAERHRRKLGEELEETKKQIRQGYDYREAHLAKRRTDLRKKVREGDAGAREQLDRIKERQRGISRRKEAALQRVRRKPELVEPGKISFITHALVIPSSDPEVQERHDDEIEKIAMRMAIAHEEAAGARVEDITTMERARASGLTDRPGFDILSHRLDGQRRAIEVKGRARQGNIELTENEWRKACNLRDSYWLYVIYGCRSSEPDLIRIPDPFGNLVAQPKGGVVVEESEILRTAE